MTNSFTRVYPKVACVLKYRKALKDVWKKKAFQSAIDRLSTINTPLPVILRLRVDLLYSFALLAVQSELAALDRLKHVVSDADKASDKISKSDKVYIQTYASELALLVCEKHNLPNDMFSVDYTRIDLEGVTRRLKREFMMTRHPSWSE